MSTCPFCDYAGPNEVLRDYDNSYVIEPLNPVTPGHLLVIPKQHQEQGMMTYVIIGNAFHGGARGGRSARLRLLQPDPACRG